MKIYKPNSAGQDSTGPFYEGGDTLSHVLQRMRADQEALASEANRQRDEEDSVGPPVVAFVVVVIAMVALTLAVGFAAEHVFTLHNAARLEPTP